MSQEFFGVVESRNDPLFLGRVQARIFGIHTPNKVDLPTEDLPWATILLGSINAATSGVGVSPTGLVEGTWVKVVFLDGDDMQQPQIIGTVAGYQSLKSNEIDFGGVIVSGEAQSLPAEVPAPQENIPAPSTGASSPNGWELGQTSKKYETGGRGCGTINDYNHTTDAGGASYGSYQFASYLPLTRPDGVARRGLNGSELQSYLRTSRYASFFAGKTPATVEFDQTWKNLASRDQTGFQADQHSFTKARFYDVMMSKLQRAGVDLTSYGAGVQDLVWSTAVQLGSGKTSVFTTPLSGKSGLSDKDIVTLVSDYKIANVASLFSSSTPAIQASVRNRWVKEKADLLALCNGQVASTASSVVIDGTPYDPNNQTNGNILQGGQFGFKDPNNRYPRPEYENLPDTNKLAYGKEAGTASEAKTKDRAIGKQLPNGASFDQPLNPYNARYPFNKVFQSEAGHVIEIDDTNGAERINIWHTSGTFVEIDAIGNMVRRVHGSDFQIVDRNAYVAVDAKLNISVGGSANIYVAGDLFTQVDGDVTVNCGNDMRLNASGRLSMTSAEAIDMRAPEIFIEGSEAAHIRSNSIYAQGESGVSIKSGGEVATDGSKIYLNSGKSSEASRSKAAPLGARVASSEVEVQDVFQTKQDNAAIQMETPDEGDITAYYAELVKNGVATKEQLEQNPITIGDDSTGNPVGTEASPVNCLFINSLQTIPDNFRLSQNFVLSDLSSNAKVSKYPVKAQLGLSKSQIVCNLYQLSVNVLEKIKQAYPNMIVTSGFRSVDSSTSTSDHPRGHCADIQFTGLAKSEYFNMAVKLKSLLGGNYDQLILESTSYGNSPWIHISYKAGGNRSQVFTMFNHKKVADKLVNLN